MQLLDSREALLQVGDDVVDVLCADGQADGVGLDALIQQLLCGQLGMGGGGGMDHQALDVRHVGQQGEDLQIIDELMGLLLAALDLEGEDGSAAVGEVLLVQGVVGMIRQAGVVDLFHQGMVGQVLHDLLGVLRMALRRRDRVSVPCSSRKAAKGEMVAPVSRSRMARM